MTRRLRLIRLPIVTVCAVLLFAAGAAADPAQLLKEKLDRRIEAEAPKAGHVKTAAAKARLEAMRAYYDKQQYRSLWLDGARPGDKARQLLAVLAKSEDHGLNPKLYGFDALSRRAEKAAADDAADLELDLTIAYLDYAGDVSSGVVENPRQVAGTFRDAKRTDPGKLLEQLASAADVAKHLANLAPDSRRYQNVKAALARYREIEKKGGWPAVSKGPTLKPGMTHARVAEVRKRLAVTGELAGDTSSTQYDAALAAAVKKFQERHGLVADGNVGADTANEMSVPVKARIEQLVINLERRRWLAGHLGDRYIYVNIADNDVKVVVNDKTVHVTRAVVGKPFHETPVFSGMMTYIELSPYWNVPHSIATRDLLPQIKRSPGFIEGNNYLLLTRMGDNNSAISSLSVDWSTISAGNFPYHLRQKPGPWNALGTMAFMFPNPHNVFLHDTSKRSLFSVEDRYFSSGCVRIEFPMKLALLLLKDQDNGAWTEKRILDIVEKKDPVRVNLKNPIPVHITYLTAWADPDGTVQFRKDGYKRDAALKVAMRNVGSIQ
jgi:murein L,D-transpeptidase YcbB/YkuD